MKTQACDPCAKRKVRCDRNEPCSNCKRRKQDHCTYADISPAEKIKLLEAQVRSLGGDPSNLIQAGGTLAEASQRPSTNQEQGGIRINQTPTRHIGPKATDPVLREEEGQLFYLESYVLLIPEILALIFQARMAELAWSRLSPWRLSREAH